MPKIGGWSRVGERNVQRAVNVRKAWVHDETNEVVTVSKKTPHDGHYIFHQMEAPEDLGSLWGGDGELIGYDPGARYAERIATRWLRENPGGTKT